MTILQLCDPKKYPSPVQGGWGVSKAKMFKGKYETKLEFPEGCRVGGGVCQTKKGPLWEGYGYFLAQYI